MGEAPYSSSTHVLDVAENLCDKVSIIKQGKLIISGNMEAVRGSGSLEDVFMEVVEHEKSDICFF